MVKQSAVLILAQYYEMCVEQAISKLVCMCIKPYIPRSTKIDTILGLQKKKNSATSMRFHIYATKGNLERFLKPEFEIF